MKNSKNSHPQKQDKVDMLHYVQISMTELVTDIFMKQKKYFIADFE